MQRVIQFWHSGRLPADIRAAYADWAIHAADFELLRFDARAAETLLEQHYSPREVDAFRRCALPSMASDYFRYHAIHALGGFYVDAGWRPLASISRLIQTVHDPAKDGFIFVIPHSLVEDPLIQKLGTLNIDVPLNGFIYAATPGCALLRLASQLATRNVERRVAEKLAYVTGIGVLVCLANADRYASGADYLAALRAAAEADAEFLPALAVFAGFVDEVGFPAVTAAASGMRLAPFRSIRQVLQRTDIGGRRKTHWSQHGGSIYREAT